MATIFIKSAVIFCAILSTLTYAEPTEIWVDSYTPAAVMTTKSAVADKDAILYYSKETPVITLEPLVDSKDTLQARSYRAQRSAMLGNPLKAGVKRSVLATETVEKLNSYLDWETLKDGSHIAALSILSPRAAGSRFIFNVETLHPRAELRFHDHVNDEIFTVSGEEIINIVFTNRQESFDADIGNDFYVGPYLNGEQATLEIFLPKEVAVSEVQLSLPYLSHIFIAPNQLEQLNKRYGDQSCMKNAICDASMTAISDSVAKILFTDINGDSHICTGTLLNDTQNSQIPYLLTANHCINTKQKASTLQTFWFYNAESCVSSTVVLDYKQLAKGADLLFNHVSTDTALLRLSEAAPIGTTYAGWTTDQARTSEVYVFHHPDGRSKKMVMGQTDSSYANCQATEGTSFSCNKLDSDDAGYLTVKYSSSATAEGSSGAGLFILRNSPSQSSGLLGASRPYYIAGQLYGGNTSCDAGSGNDFYGRFDLAFKAGLATWLVKDIPAPPTVVEPPPLMSKSGIFRFYNTNLNTHFFTSSEAERDNVINKYASFVYEGRAFYAYSKINNTLSPVYRFYHKVLGSHFYTISKGEKEHVEKAYPDYIYEGIGWYAAPVAVSGSTPLYRFYNTKTGTHFYTVTAEEKDNIIMKYPSYIYEGIAYYVWKEK